MKTWIRIGLLLAVASVARVSAEELGEGRISEPLPELQEILGGHAAEVAAIRQRAVEAEQALRSRTAQQLQTLQDTFTRAARLDDALQVRDAIRRFQPTPLPRSHYSEQPDRDATSPYDWRDRVGASFVCTVTGNTTDSVWGTDVYTDDSSVATAAVHAGVLRAGETGRVKVTIVGPGTMFMGSVRNGVSTSSWSVFGGSFRVEAVGGAKTGGTKTSDAGNDPARLYYLANRDGQVLYFDIVGETSGSVWGTDVYTTDSSLAAAAVHAGLVEVGKPARVMVTICPGQTGYTGSVRNGVTSRSWSGFPLSFRVQAITARVPALSPRSQPSDQAPDSLVGYQHRIGETLTFVVTGATDGAVWGTNIYTCDSQLAAAAVHAGILDVGERRTVRVTILPGQSQYTGSNSNGVSSYSWTSPYAASYRFERSS